MDHNTRQLLKTLATAWDFQQKSVWNVKQLGPQQVSVQHEIHHPIYNCGIQQPILAHTWCTSAVYDKLQKGIIVENVPIWLLAAKCCLADESMGDSTCGVNNMKQCTFHPWLHLYTPAGEVWQGHSYLYTSLITVDGHYIVYIGVIKHNWDEQKKKEHPYINVIRYISEMWWNVFASVIDSWNHFIWKVLTTIYCLEFAECHDEYINYVTVFCDMGIDPQITRLKTVVSRPSYLSITQPLNLDAHITAAHTHTHTIRPSCAPVSL